MPTYTLSAIQSSLGLSRSVITGLIKAGFVTPSRGARREYRFSFQDMVLLRTARSLQLADIPPRKILRALARLQAELPDELPLSGLRIAAEGSDITVREGGAQRAVESGQWLIDFGLLPGEGGSVHLLAPTPAPERPPAPDWYQQAVDLEASDKRGAEQAYRQAIAADPANADAALNLGVLLIDAGQADEAARVYRQAIERVAPHPWLHFNLAIALEDLGRHAEALAQYEACLALAPDTADAHFNAGRLHEALGQQHQALRHYSAYRRLLR
jgi:tetratricopeptide (TPR) repeat protein